MLLQDGTKAKRSDGIFFRYTVFLALRVHAVNVLVIGVEGVERKLKGYIDGDGQKAENRQGKPTDFKSKVHLTFANVTKTGDQIIS